MVCSDDDNVIMPWLKTVFVPPKIFPAKPLDPVSVMRLADLSTGRDPQPRASGDDRFVPLYEEDQTPGRKALSIAADQNKIPTAKQAIRFCKAFIDHKVCRVALLHWDSRRQPLAPFGPASVDNTPTAFGRHPFSESVIPQSLDPTRLKSPFHINTPTFLVPQKGTQYLMYSTPFCQGKIRPADYLPGPPLYCAGHFHPGQFSDIIRNGLHPGRENLPR